MKPSTILVYFAEAPELHNAGTDSYDASPVHKLVARAPYDWNAELVFHPRQEHLALFTKRPIRA